MKKTIFSGILLLFLNLTAFSQTIDESFHEPLPIRAAKTTCIKTQPDGKLLVGGDISFFGNKKVKNLVRLNPDGSQDETFKFNYDGSFIIKHIEIQSNGNIIVLMEDYDSRLGIYYGKFSIIKLDSNGNVINTIKDLTNSTTLSSLVVLSDDKVLFSANDDKKGTITRYNSDLTLDETFQGKVTFDNFINEVTLNQNKIYVCGPFTKVNNTVKNDIVRLNIDGSLDQTFDIGKGTDDPVNGLSFQSDGKILIERSFINKFGDKFFHGLVRLNTDGTVDTDFNPPYLNGPTFVEYNKDKLYYTTSILVDYQIITKLMRLNLDGSSDEAFNSILVDNDSYLDACIEFNQDYFYASSSSISGNKYGLSKYNIDGKVITEYQPELGRYGIINNGDVINGKLYIGGDFIKIDNTNTYNIARLNSNGTLDESFKFAENKGTVVQLQTIDNENLLISTGKSFFKIDQQGKIVGDFNFKFFKTLYQVIKFKVLDNGKIVAGDCNNVFLLNADGTENKDYDIGTGIDDGVTTTFDFDAQSDKIILGSKFQDFNGKPVKRLIRLQMNGSIDESFNVGEGPNEPVSMIKILDNGEVLVGGNFSTFNAKSVPFRLVKLSKDGKIDSTFIENQKKAINFNGPEIYNVKVVQVDSTIYIKGLETITAIQLNGKVTSNFSIPFKIEEIKDLIVTNETFINNSRVKSLANSPIKSKMLTLGRFIENGKTDPSFLVSLKLQKSSATDVEPIIEQKKIAGFYTYPNPVKSSLKVVLTQAAEQGEVVIYDQSGKVRFNSGIQHISAQVPYEIDLRGLFPGTYIVQVKNMGKTVSSQKFLKIL